jgi:MOSC domain-containing protein YiiM
MTRAAIHVHQVSVNPDGGVPKRATPEAFIAVDGVRGDRQRNLKHHGGPNRAVCLFSLERIEALRAEGHPIAPGTTGENLTLSGIDWDRVVPGVKLKIGDQVELEVLKYTEPCKTIAASFTDGQFGRILQEKHPGFSRVYARVLREGIVRTGDTVSLSPPPAE